MRNPQVRTFSNDELIAAGGLREVAAQARVGMFGGGLAIEGARVKQLTRDRDRALRRGDEARAVELDGRLRASKSLMGEMRTERAKEGIVPSPVPAGKAVVRGRVTDRREAAKGLQVSLLGSKGEQLAAMRTDARGFFELPHEPTDRLTVRVTDSKGAHLLDRSGLAGPPADSSIYLELRVDNIAPMPPPPDPPPTDSEPKGVIVPALRGFSEDEARKALSAVNLNGRRDGEVPSTDLAGRVVSQDPKSGETIERGGTVGYTLGSAERDPFPDLRGEVLRNAVAKVSEMKLAVDAIELVDDQGNAGRIVDTLPAPGEPFTRETRVMLRVGAGDDKADLTTAAFLFANDPRAQRADMNEATVRRRMTDAGVASAADLRSLAKESAEAIDERFKIGNRQHARLVQQVLAEVMAKFPDRKG